MTAAGEGELQEEVEQQVLTAKGENHTLRTKLNDVRRRRKKLQDLLVQENVSGQELLHRLNQENIQQQRALLDFQSVVLRKRKAESDLKQQWNVMNDCFHISHIGPFATINGLRLGSEALPLDSAVEATAEGISTGTNNNKKPEFGKVPWVEINSALGEVALLLQKLEKMPHCGIKLSCEIVPMGSTSKIGVRRVNSSTSLYNLYSDDSFQFFGKRNFNFALQCLVQCVADATESILRRDRTCQIPHAIEKTVGTDQLTVGGLSIQYSTESGVEWTRAMKYLLTDLKHLLTYRALSLFVHIDQGPLNHPEE